MSRSVRHMLRYATRVKRPDAAKVLLDALLIVIAAGWTWFASYGQLPDPGSPWPFISVVLGCRLVIYVVLRLHHLSWFHVSRYDVLWLAASAALGPPAIGLTYAILPEPFTFRGLLHPDLILLTEPAFYLILLCGARITARALYSGQRREADAERVLIIGAGAAGRALAFQIQEQEPGYAIVGMIDDDARRQGRRIRGIRILGTTNDVATVAHTLQVRQIMIAIPSLSPERLREMLAACEPANVPVRILPPLRELMTGKLKVQATALREVRMEDLLPRAEIKMDPEAITTYLRGKCVLVTGGGGSIGGEVCRQALAAGARQLLVMGRGENSVFEMVQELNESGGGCVVTPVICDVRDRAALERAIVRLKPQVIFHAAAHKHVPLMEQYPCEAIKNNVGGTLNVVELGIAHGVESFVMVSTDKAVEPSNIMGASKRLCEMIVKGYATQHAANMVSVRFGNVLGSRGSVVPTMRRQISRRLPVTVTDPNMVRFFMTIPEAVQLVLHAGSLGGCGELFVLDMGRPVRILDLAYDLIRLSGLVPNQDIPVRIIGPRPGEKMHEDILTADEATRATKKGSFFMAASQHVDLSHFMARVHELRELSESGEDERVLAIVRELVPDFHSNGSSAPTMPRNLELVDALGPVEIESVEVEARGIEAHTRELREAPEKPHGVAVRV